MQQLLDRLVGLIGGKIKSEETVRLNFCPSHKKLCGTFDSNNGDFIPHTSLTDCQREERVLDCSSSKPSWRLFILRY